MPSSDAAWNIYAEQMVRARLGIGLWQPGPAHSYRKIRIGHVGYIKAGRFHMIFDANGDIEGQDVPEGFESLPQECQVVDASSRPPQRLHMDMARSVGLDVTASSALPPAPAGGGFSFHSSSSRGATLLTQDLVQALDAERERKFKQYIKKHHASWVKFAQDRGHDIELKDIILVTGHDTTKDYAMAAFANNSSTLRLEFKAGIENLLSASATAWGTWEASPQVHQTCGPLSFYVPSPGASTPPSPSTSQDHDESPLASESSNREDFDQCVFVRGFHMRKRMKIFSPIAMKAAAGYDVLDVGDRREGSSDPVLAYEGETDSPIISTIASQDTEENELEPALVSNSSTFANPLEPLFEYIFERSTVNFAIAHDLDVLRLAKLAGVDHFEDLSALLAMTNPDVVAEDDVAGISFSSDESPRALSPAGLESISGLNENDGFPAGEESRRGITSQMSGTPPHTATNETSPSEVVENYDDDSIDSFHRLVTQLSDPLLTSGSAFPATRPLGLDQISDIVQPPVSSPTSNKIERSSTHSTAAHSPDMLGKIQLLDVHDDRSGARELPRNSEHEVPLGSNTGASDSPAKDTIDLGQPMGPTNRTIPSPLPWSENPLHHSSPKPRSSSEDRAILSNFIRAMGFQSLRNRQAPSIEDIRTGRYERAAIKCADLSVKYTNPPSGDNGPDKLGSSTTVVVDGYSVDLLCRHEVLWTLFMRGVGIGDSESRIDTEITQATYKVSYTESAPPSKSLIQLDLRSASLLSFDRPEPPYVVKYMDELRKHHLYVEVEDDIKFGDGPQHAYKHPEYFEHNMVQFAHSAAVNIYMAKRWRRAVLPKHSKDQFLSPLAEISSLWAIQTATERNFLIHFAAPEVQSFCVHSVILYLNIEDISFFADDDASADPKVHRGWRLAFIMDTLEVKTDSAVHIKLDLKSPITFSEEYSKVSGYRDLRPTTPIVSFLKLDYLPMLGRVSLDTIYSSTHKVEVYIPSKVPGYLKGVDPVDGYLALQRHDLDESIQAYGFDQITAVSEEAINHIFYSLWSDARGRRTDNSMATLSTPDITASFGAPVIRLLSNGKAIIWFRMTEGVFIQQTRDSPGSFAGHSDPPAISGGTKDRANSDYGIEDECFFAFEVSLMVIEDPKLSIVEQLRNRSRRADTWSFLSSNRESYLVKHLLLNLQSGEFVPELSMVSGLGTGRASASRLDSMLRHMSKYMAQLAQDGCNVIYSIPIWTNRVTVSSSALTDCKHQVATKDEITRENCGIDREAHDCPVVLILGSRVFRPLSQITVPWIDGWPMRNKDQTTLRTIYVSRDTFLKPLLPILKAINRRTTLTPKNVAMIDGKWTVDVGTFEDTFRYNKQACDWRQDKLNHDPDGLHFVWSHSEDVARGYRPDIDSIQSSEFEPAGEHQDQKAEFLCRTKNTLVIPMFSRPDCLDMSLTGESVLRLNILGQNLSFSSYAKWAGTMRFIPGPSGFTPTFVDKIEPTWSHDDPFSDIVQLHKQKLGAVILTDDVRDIAARMIQDQCKFMCPGLQDFLISSPIIRPKGMILQVYEKKSTPPSSRQLSTQRDQKLYESPKPLSWDLAPGPHPSSHPSVTNASASRSASMHKAPQANPYTIWRPDQKEEPAESQASRRRQHSQDRGSRSQGSTTLDESNFPYTRMILGAKRSDSLNQPGFQELSPPPAYESLSKSANTETEVYMKGLRLAHDLDDEHTAVHVWAGHDTRRPIRHPTPRVLV